MVQFRQWINGSRSWQYCFMGLEFDKYPVPRYASTPERYHWVVSMATEATKKFFGPDGIERPVTAIMEVFDGHGGTDATLFVRNNILKFIIEDPCFPICSEKALKSAFLKADYAFADDTSIDISSGTTALTALNCLEEKSTTTQISLACWWQ